MKKILLAIAVLLCAVGCKNTNGKVEVKDQAAEVAVTDFPVIGQSRLLSALWLFSHHQSKATRCG